MIVRLINGTCAQTQRHHNDLRMWIGGGHEASSCLVSAARKMMVGCFHLAQTLFTDLDLAAFLADKDFIYIMYCLWDGREGG